MLNSEQLVDRLLMEGCLLEYKLSSTQINLPPEHADFLVQWGRTNIPDKVLFTEEADNGRETEPHVTVLYGLTEPTPGSCLTDILDDFPVFEVDFGLVSIFENEKYDVVKLSVESPLLRVLHAQIKAQCSNEYKFPDYQPHCTLAYVLPGEGARFKGRAVFEGEGAPKPSFWVKDVLFSGKGEDNLRKSFSLRSRKEAAGEVAETKSPFDGIPFSDVQTWMRSRGVRPRRNFVG